MSICSEDNDVHYESFEYNPCIRKGKHKPVHKKQKKYEAKVQKMNLIRPKRGKLISTNCDSIINNSAELIDNMIKILKSEDELKWDEDYEALYTHIFRFKKDDDLDKNYTKIKLKIYENECNDKYDDYDDYDHDYYEYRYSCFRYRRYRRYWW
jgi:hypothetical protein